jgi:transketolase
MFGETGRNIRLAGLNDQGRYDFYQAEADRLFGQIGGASTAEELQRLAGQINQDINAAFALLSPDQQAAMQQEWLTRLENVNTVAQERATALQEQARQDANATLDRVEAMMTDLASRQASAADTQAAAANIQLFAANTPHTVNVNVDLSTGAATVNEGG